jgi:multiple sugar transport system permease protein
MLSQRRRTKLLPYLYLVPCLILIGAILLYPVLVGIYTSLLSRDMFDMVGRFVGLQNFRALADDRVFLLALGNTLWWTGTVVLGQYVLGMMLALLLNEDVRGRFVFRALILVPWVIPLAVAAVAWKWIYAEYYGILNHILRSLGIISGNVAWLANHETAMWSVITVGIWKGIPFVAIVLLAALQSIPREEYEAAMIDGAGGLQSFVHITLPHLRGISFIVIVLTTIWNFNQFDLTHILTRGGPGDATQLLSTYTYQLYFSAFQFSFAAAVAVVMLVVLMSLTVIYIKRII